MPEENDLSPEIDNIRVARLDEERFQIVFGARTEIPNLYSAIMEIEIDRDLLEQFLQSAEEALEE